MKSKTKFEHFFNIDSKREKYIPNSKIYCLIIYDISDTKRRNRLVKILKGFGYRVQKSAFEAMLTKSKFKLLRKRLERFYRTGDDIRLYRFNGKAGLLIFGDEDMTVLEDNVFI
ncbi:MAG: CRISPR-associated endonuclease Cas2 [Candidatus Ancillula sp.]|jgi:CRISPR-associated endonuclease Cas2|nr:CRISPR-associated endonuclease Cas2 [Candidatus Ancillula sp.]